MEKNACGVHSLAVYTSAISLSLLTALLTVAAAVVLHGEI